MSTKPAAIADLDAGTITRTVRIAAPPAVVWRALTTPEHVAAWWKHPMRFPDGIRPGSVGIFEHAEGDDFTVRIDRVDEPTHYGFTWGFDEDLGEEKATTVLFELMPDGGGTSVTVTEEGFTKLTDAGERRAQMDDNTEGWNLVLDWLADHVATMSG